MQDYWVLNGMSIDEHAAKRRALHEGFNTQRIFHEDAERVGVVGEFTFGLKYGYQVVTHDGYTDRGVDFSTPAGTVDVKASCWTGPDVSLIVSAGKVLTADILVLCRVPDAKKDYGYLMGWIWSAEVADYPVRTLPHGDSHMVHEEELYPMDDRFMVDPSYKPEAIISW